MSGRYVCERCGPFESDDARCPKCLRKSSVREAGERTSASDDAARLARGESATSPAGRRATALVIAVALSALLASGVSLAWGGLGEARVPAVVATVLGAIVWLRAALRDAPGEARPWAAFARHCAVGLGLALWAFVSGVLALATTADYSAPFTAAMGVVVFLGGVVPVLRWMQAREARDEAPAPSGKWR